MLKFTPRYRKSIAAVAVAGVLALSSLGGAFAASPADHGKPAHGIFGTLVAQGANSLTIATKEGSKVELAVTSNTKFRAPGKAEASSLSLPVGSRVAILAEGAAGSQSAVKVMLVPGESQREHRVLTVTDVSGKTVVAEDAQGHRIEVELDHEVDANIKGQLVTFVGASSQRSNRFKANVEVKIGQVVKRLEGQAKKVEAEAKGEANAEARANKEKDLAALKARLEDNMQRHLDLFAEVIAKAPPQSKASLEAALQTTLNGHRATLEALGEPKADVATRLHQRTLHGSVEAINTQANEITVKSRRGVSVTLKMTGNPPILSGEKAGNLSNLAVGDQVKVRYDSQTSSVGEIRVQTEAGAEARGTVQSADTAKGQTEARSRPQAQPETEVHGTIQALALKDKTYIMTLRLRDGSTRELVLHADTVVRISDRPSAAADLRPGMEVEARFRNDTGAAVRINTARNVQTKVEANGTIIGIDTASRAITVNLDGGGTLTLQATGDTTIEFNGQGRPLANLQTGARVKIEYNTETLVASAIRARSRP